MNYFKSVYVYIFIFIILVFITLSVLSSFKARELSNFLKLQTEEAEYRYGGMVLFPKDTSDIIFSTLINTPEVISIFEKANTKDKIEQLKVRQKLLKHLLSSYEHLVSYNIQQLHFHLPNNDSFLRFHRPGKFGDNLTEVRKTVAYVNKYHIPIQGFEEGKIFNGYRFVYPLFNEEKKHLGSVEVSHSIQTMAKMYHRSFENSSLNIVLKKELVTEKLFHDEMKNYEPYILNDDFVNQKSMGISNHIIEINKNIEDFEFLKNKMKKFENFSIPIKHEEHYDLVSFIRIENPITTESIAYAISFQKSEWLNYYYSEYEKQKFLNLLLSFLFSLGVFFASRYYFSIQKKAYEDGLTQIHNRLFFEKYLDQKYTTLEREGTQLSLIMLDIDHFKKINDTHGHKVGDDALKYLVHVVNDNIRKSDVFARWGGEEFMVLIEEDLETAYKIAENLREKIDKLTEYEVNVPHFTCSFGIISLTKDISLDQSYIIVDDRLYKAKELGRNKVVGT